MSDDDPRATGYRLTLVAPLIIAAIVVVIAVMTLLSSKHSAQPAPHDLRHDAQSYEPTSITVTKGLLTSAPRSRWELIEIANQIAADYAAGVIPPIDAEHLVGSSFVVRVAFGCEGINTSFGTGQLSATYDVKDQSIRLVARPSDWTQTPLVQSLSNAASIETAEGFWIPRSWTFADGCPPKGGQFLPAIPTPSAAETLGLAQLFAVGASRLIKHSDQPYQTILKASSPDLLSHIYRLVLEGKIVGFSDGRAIHCWVESSDHRPVCYYAVQWSRVAIDDAEDDKVLAEWQD